MSRDQFIRRATMLGISATAIGGMFAAPGKATAADLKVAGSLAGSTVNLLVAAEGDEKGIQDKFGEIKNRFGIDVKMTALAVGPLIEKPNQSVKAPTGTYDLIIVLGFTVAHMVGGGYFDAAQRVRRDEGSGGLRLRGLPRRRAQVRRLLRPRQRRVRRQDALPDPGPPRRPVDHLLPQGPVRGRRHLGADDWTAVPGSREDAATATASPATP